ncbi:MAG: shikimate kinase AroK [Gammaproteobacteria bacterium]|nr:MAG: shikimate kinase AroK [Gammaproteobacteria bacterium]
MGIIQNVFLIGPMGAGKSAVGRQLSRMLRMQFLDSDAEIEERTGVDIPFIFEKEGEAGFRKRERLVIDELSGGERVVLATGGGAVLDPDNRACLRSRGIVIYLHASVSQQLQRTRRSRGRPLLHTPDPGARLAELMQQREPIYRDMADHVIDTDGRRVPDVARQILHCLDEESTQDG